MSAKPPPIPELVYQRVMLVGKIDGLMVLFSAGFLALMTASSGFWVFTVTACLAAGTGAMELHGVRMLAQGDERGMNWLVRAQLLLLMVVLAFVLYYLGHFDTGFYAGFIPEFRARAAETYGQLGLPNPYEKLSNAELLMLTRLGQNMILVAIGLVSCVYQGLMARYYFKRRETVAKALDRIFGEAE